MAACGGRDCLWLFVVCFLFFLQVQRDSLFCIMAACNGLLATALLKLVDSGKINLNDPVSHVWDGFVRYGKHHITVEDVLTHRGGMHRVLPENLTLTQLTDYETMIALIENAVSCAIRGTRHRRKERREEGLEGLSPERQHSRQT